ncbi:MAG TPA: magnesium transporter CorA family protein [Nitrosopumilaceae archaeon]|nr:magnesium transporter CorA family protein [Nitrosopumilaceae archaeon]
MKKDFFSNRLRYIRKTNASDDVQHRIEVIEGEKFSWIDLQNPHRDDVENLSKKYHFNSLNIEDCMTKFELPKLDSYDDQVFLILHFPPLNGISGMPKFSQLSIFMGSDFLVTIHQGDLTPLVDMVNVCKGDTDSQRKQRLIGKSTGSLLHEIIDVLVDDMLHTVRKIVGNLDDIEDIVFDEKKAASRQISLLRREITKLRRIVHPLKRIILETAKNLQRLSKSEEDLTLYFDDIIDHVDKVIESLEESKETLEIYKDTDFMLSTEKSNKILSMLTLIFTLSIPATVIGQFYGMNVNIPGGVETGVWTMFGPYTTFIFIILISVVPAFFMFLYFRRLGWISN